VLQAHIEGACEQAEAFARDDHFDEGDGSKQPVPATWIIRSKTSVSVMALALTSPPYNI